MNINDTALHTEQLYSAVSKRWILDVLGQLINAVEQLNVFPTIKQKVWNMGRNRQK
jgi:hypothetical protein